MKNKVILIVRDGWGYRAEEEKNFVKLAKTKNIDKLEKKYPTLLLEASGPAVGLPKGFMGNSEVGHMTLGAGQILKQSLLRINESIEKNDFQKLENLKWLFQKVKENSSKLHLIILFQKAGVHSHLDHLFATLEAAKNFGFQKDEVFIHMITDGRDEDREAGISFFQEAQAKIKELSLGKIVSVSGRYFAMDRNNNWERTEKYYSAIVEADAKKIDSIEKYLEENYQKSVTDEFIEPAVLKEYPGMNEKDGVFFLNFRKDRARQLTKSFNELDLKQFKRRKFPKIFLLTMTRYYNEADNRVLFDDLKVENTLGEILEKEGKTQLRIAETEKFAHVTFFFDGGVKKNYSGKTETIIPSPDVSTYDLKPEMSAHEVTDWILHEAKKNDFDFILVNFANPDMVGHTGNFEAIKKAVETIDLEVGRIYKKLHKKYNIILTGDHGNVEDKREKTLTTHTTNPVPTTFIADKDDLKKIDFDKLKGLADLKDVVLKWIL